MKAENLGGQEISDHQHCPESDWQQYNTVRYTPVQCHLDLMA